MAPTNPFDTLTHVYVVSHRDSDPVQHSISTDPEYVARFHAASLWRRVRKDDVCADHPDAELLDAPDVNSFTVQLVNTADGACDPVPGKVWHYNVATKHSNDR